MAALRYVGKVTMVTGGSKGIGEGIVRAFVREGAQVSFCGRGESVGRALEAHLNKEGPGKAMFITADVSKPSDLEKFVKVTLDAWGRIDCVVNNAGWHPHATPVDEFSLEDFKSLLDLNLISYWYMMKLTMKELRKTKGNVINISSLSGFFGQAGSSIYCATKGGITAMSKSVAIDEAKYDVRINTLSPGNVWTPLWEEHVAGPTAQEEISKGNNAQLLGRMGTIEECGEVAVHLATATYTTGIEYLLTGGAELGYSVKNRKL